MTVLWIIIGILVFFMYYVIGIGILTTIDAITEEHTDDDIIMLFAIIWPICALIAFNIFLAKACGKAGKKLSVYPIALIMTFKTLLKLDKDTEAENE